MQCIKNDFFDTTLDNTSYRENLHFFPKMRFGKRKTVDWKSLRSFGIHIRFWITCPIRLISLNN